MTFEEAARLAQPGDLVRGEFVPSRPASWRHGEVAANIAMVLKPFLTAHPDWSGAMGSPGVKLSHSPDTLRGPDLAVIRTERAPIAAFSEGWLEGAPDLAIEILDTDESMTALLEKALEYVAAGAAAVWNVDVGSERVVVVTPPRQIHVLTSSDFIDGSSGLPGFSCAVSAFFE